MRPLRPLSRASLNEPATGLRREGRAANQRLLAGRPRRLNGHAQPPGRMRLPAPARAPSVRRGGGQAASEGGREGHREEGRAAAAAGAGAARGSVGRAGGGAPRRGAA